MNNLILIHVFLQMIDDDLNNSDDEEVESGPDFNYILSMPIWNLTKEKKEELCKKRDEKVNIYNHYFYICSKY